MSDRERWIIYPLLVMALSLSIRDKFTPDGVRELKVHRLVCHQMEAVSTIDGKPQIRLSATPLGGRIEMRTAVGTEAIQYLPAGDVGTGAPAVDEDAAETSREEEADGAVPGPASAEEPASAPQEVEPSPHASPMDS